MEYYFFLAASGIKPEITLSNFPPAICDVVLSECFVCSATPQSGKWTLRTIRSIKPYESCVVNGDLLNLDEDALRQTLVFMSRTPMQGEHAALPVLEDFSSWPEWRANLRIRAPHSSVSYQGEYPAQMLNVKNGTLVSVAGMLQNAQDVQNKLFLVNFTQNPVRRNASLEFSRVKNRKLIKRVTVMTNQVTCVDLSDIILEGEEELILVSSKEIYGIPIYFSHSTDYRYLSLEHTHPPIEMTVFGEMSVRFSAMKKMKNFWLSYAK